MTPMTPEGLYDIYGIWHVPFWQTKTFFICSITLLIVTFICLIFVVLKYYLRRKKNIPLWDQALHDIGLLESHIIHDPDGKATYSALINIVKQYLNERYQLNALSYTDSELLILFKQLIQLEHIMVELDDLWVNVDYVKFGYKTIDRLTLRQQVERTKMIVRKTIPTPQEIKAQKGYRAEIQ